MMMYRCRVLHTRQVWAALTAHPTASVAELAEYTRLSLTTVRHELRLLREAGYIETKRGSKRARTVIVPFYTTGFRIVKRAA